MSACPKCGGDFHWYPEINEAGWRCSSCEHRPGEPDGYDPNLDVELLEVKVNGLLHDLHGAKLIYMSNNSHAEGVVASVAARCRDLSLFDQHTIVRLIFEDDGHAKYWATIGDGVRSGNDQRRRCAGGNLSTGSSGTGAGWRYWCFSKGCSCGGIEGPPKDGPCTS